MMKYWDGFVARSLVVIVAILFVGFCGLAGSGKLDEWEAFHEAAAMPSGICTVTIPAVEWNVTPEGQYVTPCVFVGDITTTASGLTVREIMNRDPRCGIIKWRSRDKDNGKLYPLYADPSNTMPLSHLTPECVLRPIGRFPGARAK